MSSVPARGADHEHVADRLADDEHDDAEREELAVAVARLVRDAGTVDGECRVEDENEERAEVAVLLAENRESEVRMRLRQIVILAHAHAESHAEELSRADGRERLHDLVAGILRVLPGIPHDANALDAVGLRHDEISGTCRKRREHREQPPQRQLRGHEIEDDGDADDDAGRPHVRLFLDERRHNEDAGILQIDGTHARLVAHARSHRR